MPGQSLGGDDDNSGKEWVTPGQSLSGDDDNSNKEWVTPGQSLSDDDNSDRVHLFLNVKWRMCCGRYCEL